MKRQLILLIIALTSCSAQMGVRTPSPSGQWILEEARCALFDVKQTLAAQQLQIERLEQEVKGPANPSASHLVTSRVDTLEATQRRMIEDLNNLSNHANETSRALARFKKSIETMESALQAHSKRLGDMADLKSTLSSISDAIGQGPPAYTVRSGDSLEKIARTYNTTVESIKRKNGLKSSTIYIGQKLNIP